MKPTLKKKLDPTLRQIARDLREPQPERIDRGFAARRARGPEGGAEAPPRVGVLVKFRGDFEDLRRVGVDAPTVIENQVEGYKIAAGTIPVDRLEDLAAIDHVVVVEGPRQMDPTLNYSVPEARARALHGATPPNRGSGVFVGVIDSGFDYRHGSFVSSDGNSRFRAIWDQFLTPEGTEAAGPGSIGVLYDNAALSAALRGTGTVRTRDVDATGKANGHGTHVAGIAAGNGAPASCCTTRNTYVGVAPEAEIIAVRYDYTRSWEIGQNVFLVQAMGFIFDVATAVGRPAVINISQGADLGAHDGTSLVEQTIDSLVAGHTGRAIVVAAGNFAQEKRHAKATVPANGDIELEFTIQADDDKRRHLDLWYRDPGRLDVEVIAPNADTTARVTHGNDATVTQNDFDVDVNGTANAPDNNDHNFRITLRTPADGKHQAGTWKLKVWNTTAAPVEFHCWIQRGDNNPTFKDSQASSDSTVSIPGTARSAITVAAFANRKDCCDCCPAGEIADFSSHGPVRVEHGGTPNPKPNIAAPGVAVTSAKADAANLKGNCCDCCSDWCCCLYTDMDGTSMAAPHVAGAIALMLEKNPALTSAQILDHLRQSATAPPGTLDPNVWGAGKLNAEGAVARVVAAMPPPPPPPAPPGGLTRPRSVAAVAPVAARGAVEEEAAARGAVELAAAPFGTPAGVGEAARPGTSPVVQILRARARALPQGPLCAAVVSRHFSEVRRLINTNRRVAAMWHRGEGPMILRRLMYGAVDDTAPPALHSDTQREYIQKFLALLRQHGSPRLVAAVDRHAGMIVELLERPLAAQVADRLAGVPS